MLLLLLEVLFVLIVRSSFCKNQTVVDNFHNDKNSVFDDVVVAVANFKKFLLEKSNCC